jgi:hypothetical protein
MALEDLAGSTATGVYLTKPHDDNRPDTDVRVAYEFATSVWGGCNAWKERCRYVQTGRRGGDTVCVSECVQWKKWCAAPLVSGQPLELQTDAFGSFIWPGWGLTSTMNTTNWPSTPVTAWAVCETNKPCTHTISTDLGDIGATFSPEFPFTSCFRDWTNEQIHWIHRKSYFGDGAEFAVKGDEDGETDTYSFDRMIRIAEGRGLATAENAMIVQFGGVDPWEVQQRDIEWAKSVRKVWTMILVPAIVLLVLGVSCQELRLLTMSGAISVGGLTLAKLYTTYYWEPASVAPDFSSTEVILIYTAETTLYILAVLIWFCFVVTVTAGGG